MTFLWVDPTSPTVTLPTSGQLIQVHPDDYRPSDPDDPESPHLWQVGDRVTVTPFTLGEAQPITLPFRISV